MDEIKKLIRRRLLEMWFEIYGMSFDKDKPIEERWMGKKSKEQLVRTEEFVLEMIRWGREREREVIKKRQETIREVTRKRKLKLTNPKEKKDELRTKKPNTRKPRNNNKGSKPSSKS